MSRGGRRAGVFAAFPGQELLWTGAGDRRTRRRQRHRPDGSRQGQLRARADLLARVTVSGRGTARNARQSRRSRAWASTKAANRKLCGRGEGALASTRRAASPPGHVVHTLGAPVACRYVRRRLDLRHARNVLDIGVRYGLALAPDHRSAQSLPADEAVARDPAVARGRHDDPLRRESDSRRRLACDAAAVRRRAVPDRRYGGLPQRIASQGHSLGDQVGMLAAEAIFAALAQDPATRTRWPNTIAGSARRGRSPDCTRRAISTPVSRAA